MYTADVAAFQAVQQMQAESMGLMRACIVTRATATALHASALAGDDFAAAMLVGAAEFLECITRRTRRSALACAICDSPLWHRYRPAAVVLLTASCELKPDIAVGLGICRGCVSARTDRELARDVVGTLRAGLLPGARVIQPPHPPGRA